VSEEKGYSKIVNCQAHKESAPQASCGDYEFLPIAFEVVKSMQVDCSD
jgi:hypothetical protein